MKTKELFCANCQLVTVHNATVDGNGEYVFTCTTEDCGRFIKLPAEVATKEEADKLFEAHAEQNEGQMTVEAQEKKLDGILGEIATEETVTDTEPEE
jgi:hypothetical protein